MLSDQLSLRWAVAACTAEISVQSIGELCQSTLGCVTNEISISRSLRLSLMMHEALGQEKENIYINIYEEVM